jgi:O-acetyl-ADP-ribose deacetylase (regulator of RNase III)
LETGLNAVAEQARKLSATVHMPRIGCGLAGGEWSKVEAIVNKTLVDIDVCVYDF